jgi:hypothetical protein
MEFGDLEFVQMTIAKLEQILTAKQWQKVSWDCIWTMEEIKDDFQAEILNFKLILKKNQS